MCRLVSPRVSSSHSPVPFNLQLPLSASCRLCFCLFLSPAAPYGVSLSLPVSVSGVSPKGTSSSSNAIPSSSSSSSIRQGDFLETQLAPRLLRCLLQPPRETAGLSEPIHTRETSPAYTLRMQQQQQQQQQQEKDIQLATVMRAADIGRCLFLGSGEEPLGIQKEKQGTA